MTETGTGRIVKSLSGFYYVDTGTGEPVTCRGRGKLRHQQQSPLVGDWVRFTPAGTGEGTVEEILPRKNSFSRPAVANVDQLVLIVSDALPVTDPFLIDRMTALAEAQDCGCVVCINKCDLVRSERLRSIYAPAGFPTLQVSAATREGLEELKAQIADKVSVFTGNSGVGKSSLLNALKPGFSLPVGQVSQRLGRGRHTTRHVELYPLGGGALAADTPGFSSFEDGPNLPKERLAEVFREFRPYLGECRFVGCAHVKERGCAVLRAVKEGKISESRHASYCRLYEQAGARREWEQKNK
ncbi:MAG: ribosome small subunit-dependent GTPase A [Oscillospiraceae bacterium]|nr:ribosome small subunit-dependent GTPase A [Oscillospiraceae bacterium]